MIAFEGKVKGNTIVVENDDISAYNGDTVIVTVLDKSFSMIQKNKSSRPSHRVRASQSLYRNNAVQDADDPADDDSFNRLLQLKKGFQFDENFDAEKEIEEALAEKYGSFD